MIRCPTSTINISKPRIIDETVPRGKWVVDVGYILFYIRAAFIIPVTKIYRFMRGTDF